MQTEIDETLGNQNLSRIAPFPVESQSKSEIKHQTSNETKNDFYPLIKEEKKCIKDRESYCFLIAWSILNYFIILIFAILLMSWFDTNKRSTQIRKNVLEIIRQVNMQNQEGLDLLDSAISNV